MDAKRFLLIAVLILGLAVGLASCGKDDSTPTSSQQAQKKTPAQAPPPSPAVTPPPSPSSPSQSAQMERPRKGDETQENVSWPPLAPDGTEVTLSDNLLARNYYVILDSSGSMGEIKCSGNVTKSEAAKEAMAEFAKSVPPDANLGLAVFDLKGIAERAPLGVENRDAFIAAVNATVPGAATPLHDATLLGYQKLEEAARSQAGYGEYHLVIVTDGQAYPAAQDPTPVVAEILRSSPIVIHTIGFCIGTNHSLNQPGRTIYKAANNPRELRRGLGEVLSESPSFDVTGFKDE